jgi:hypothetical protein
MGVVGYRCDIPGICTCIINIVYQMRGKTPYGKPIFSAVAMFWI